MIPAALRKLALSLLALLTIQLSAIAQPPPGYYDTAVGLSGTQLRTAIHTRIRGHTVIPYDHSSQFDTRQAVRVACLAPGSTTQVRCVYSTGSSFATMDLAAWPNWNREHCWPQSRGCNSGPQKSDMHHIFACNASANTARGNKIYANGGTGPAHANAPLCTTTSTTWQVNLDHRGDIARAMLYLDLRYEGTNGERDLVLTTNHTLIDSANNNMNNFPNNAVYYFGNLQTLIQWHNEDPVDDFERNRNNYVYSRQNNRNPFIDHPQLVNLLYGTGGTFNPGGTTQTLTSGTAVSSSVTQGTWKHYQISVPTGATSLNITMTGTGDADLYVRRGSQPTLSAWDHRPWIGGSNETVNVTNPASGTWFISVYGYASGTSSFTLTATVGTSSGGTTSPVQILNASGSVSRGQWRNYTVTIPSGTTQFKINMTGTGDADLYTRQGSLPTTSTYAARSIGSTSTESITINNPAAGTWYVSVYGYASSSTFTVTATRQ